MFITKKPFKIELLLKAFKYFLQKENYKHMTATEPKIMLIKVMATVQWVPMWLHLILQAFGQQFLVNTAVINQTPWSLSKQAVITWSHCTQCMYFTGNQKWIQISSKKDYKLWSSDHRMLQAAVNVASCQVPKMTVGPWLSELWNWAVNSSGQVHCNFQSLLSDQL